LRDRIWPPPAFRQFINKVDGYVSRWFNFFRRLPALKVSAENEEFPSDLNDSNLFFLNDSAEMPH
jgi:hypothetical protein